MTSSLETKWIWHPQWLDIGQDTAGGFVHFHKSITMPENQLDTVKIQISADTKYKLFINSQLVCFGPVKGDQHLWFYDEIDLKPYLKAGLNDIAVRVLRLYHTTTLGTSFLRTISPGLMIRHVNPELASVVHLQTDNTWQTAIDVSTRLPIDIKEDDFLHIYEDVTHDDQFELDWVTASVLDFPNSHGITPPWKLSPRLIPYPQLAPGHFKALHNVKSTCSIQDLERILSFRDDANSSGVLLKAGTTHHFEIEATEHMTAFLAFRFGRPDTAGSTIRITYSECYEDDPLSVPYLRSKGDRCDSSKKLLGPEDVYRFGGQPIKKSTNALKYDTDVSEEVFAPFHFRTLRFITLKIQVANDSDLILKAINVTTNNYPLAVRASFESNVDREQRYQEIWKTSVRTLSNCLHDCYEDCPFYEQMQYAMDTRSSILFTYSISHDDLLARQAIIQLHNSYLPSIGLTASRAPSHQLQVIPHFSLYWICMVNDHFQYFGDTSFARRFIHTCDGVLETFAQDIDPELGLIRHNAASPHWLFVDWTDSWRPMGIPSAGVRTGYLSYTNLLYAYTLTAAADLTRGVGRLGLAKEYESRAKYIVEAVKVHCFDGRFFTDGLASRADPAQDYSQHSQIWAVLTGAATGDLAKTVLEKCLGGPLNESHDRPNISFSPASVAMSFYTLRALSCAGHKVYNSHFHQFWKPWTTQLSQNLTTWEEDTVSQRSDCHAWGCASLYEFTAEVAGIRPGAPGWTKITFQPRLGLFSDYAASVPIGGKDGSGLAHVKWQTLEDQRIKVSLQLEWDTQEPGFKSPSVQIILPDGNVEDITNERTIEREISLTET